MKIPFCPLDRERSGLKENVWQRWSQIQKSGIYLKGAQERELQLNLGNYLATNPDQLVLVGSGTDALLLSLLALDIGTGDIVITTAVSAAATAAAIQAVGATVEYLDIDPSNALLSYADLKSKITKEVKAIVPVHLYGNRVDTRSLRTQLGAWGYSNVAIVEDSAQSFGSLLGGEKIVSTSNFQAFSFYPTKNLGSWGDGGLIWCRKKEAADKVRALAFYGQEKRNLALYPRGINSRLDEWQAAVLIEKLSDLDRNLKIKKSYLDFYQNSFKELPLSFPTIAPDVIPAWHLAVICHANSQERDSLQQFLQEAQIESLVHYPIPLPLQRGLKGKGEFSEAEKWCNSILSLPLTAFHSPEEIERVASTVVSFFSTKRQTFL